MNADINATSVPSQCEAKELKISDCKHTHCSAFLPVYCKFQCFLKILRTALKQSLRCPFTLREQNDVVSISDTRNSSLCKLLVELVQINIGE